LVKWRHRRGGFVVKRHADVGFCNGYALLKRGALNMRTAVPEFEKAAEEKEKSGRN